MDTSSAAILAIVAATIACNGKISQYDAGEADVTVGPDGASIQPATCDIVGDGGGCSNESPVCLGVGSHLYTDAGPVPTVSYKCISLGACANNPTCSCFQSAAGRPIDCAYSQVVCTIGDAGIQLRCAGG